MRRALFLLTALLAACPSTGTAGQRGRMAKMQPTRSVVYKTAGNARLQIHLFEPDGHKPTDKRPAIVFFFGGGWVGGSPSQFFPHCTYLASRGMLAASAEYRVRSRHGVTPFACVTDGKSAVRWLRANAATLGIDPERTAAGGGSAGGHVAACTGVIPGLDEEGEDKTVSSTPNAMVLFNPVLSLDFAEWERRGTSAQRLEQIRKRFGGRDPKDISPCHHVEAGQPPAIVFHGKKDTTVPYATAERFAASMEKAGNACTLVGYAGQGHGFFNFGRGDGTAFVETVREADRFLAALGWLEGEPTIDAFAEQAKAKP